MKRFDGIIEGREYHQTTLYCAVLDEEVEGLTGNRVTTVKIPDTLLPPVLDVGKEYLIYFGEPNRRGQAKVDFIAEAPKKAS